VVRPEEELFIASDWRGYLAGTGCSITRST
jgi:hypothetical protein